MSKILSCLLVASLQHGSARFSIVVAGLLSMAMLQNQSWAADSANAYFTMRDGARPVKAVTEQLGILTPPPSAAPRINGARVFGVRPGRPILWRVPVSGERPMRFAASGLPAGAKFDAATGFISGAVAERGEYKICFSASNSKGSATRELKLVVGDKIGLTPQMGW